MSEQRKRQADDDREEESDEEYSPGQSDSGGSGDSDSGGESKKPRAPAREVIFVYLNNFPLGCKEACQRRIGFLENQDDQRPNSQARNCHTEEAGEEERVSQQFETKGDKPKSFQRSYR